MIIAEVIIFFMIQKFDSQGTFIKLWGSKGTGQALDKDGNIFVSDFLNKRIQKFDSQGKYRTHWEYDMSPLI